MSSQYESYSFDEAEASFHPDWRRVDRGGEGDFEAGLICGALLVMSLVAVFALVAWRAS